MFCLKLIPFRVIKYAFFVLFFMSLSGAIVHSADVVLTWDSPNDARVTGYKIFYGFADTDFTSVTKEIINSPDQTFLNIYDLKDGNTYGFTAKSIDRYNNESVFSEVIFYDVPETQDGISNDDDGSADNIDGNSSNANNNDIDDTGDNANDNDGEAAGSSGGGGCLIQTISNVNIWD